MTFHLEIRFETYNFASDLGKTTKNKSCKPKY